MTTVFQPLNIFADNQNTMFEFKHFSTARSGVKFYSENCKLYGGDYDADDDNGNDEFRKELKEIFKKGIGTH